MKAHNRNPHEAALSKSTRVPLRPGGGTSPTTSPGRKQSCLIVLSENQNITIDIGRVVSLPVATGTAHIFAGGVGSYSQVRVTHHTVTYTYET